MGERIIVYLDHVFQPEMSLRGAEFLHHRLQLLEVQFPRSAHVVTAWWREGKNISIWIENHWIIFASHSGFIIDRLRSIESGRVATGWLVSV